MSLFRPKEYFRPSTMEEAVSLLMKYGKTARPLAGGTDLLVSKDPEIEYLIDITRLPLDYIKSNKEGVEIGALTTFRELETSALLKKGPYNILAEAAHLSGHVAQRNMATIGGNICSAVPSADLLPPLIALAAKGRVVSKTGERVIPLEEFFAGPKKTVLKSDELLVEIQVPRQPANTAAVFLKIVRTHVDLALVNVAARVTLNAKRTCKDVRIVLGAVAPTPIRAKKAETLFKGKKIEDALIEKAAQTASKETKPISDLRASADYRREVSKVLVKSALKQCLEELKMG